MTELHTVIQEALGDRNNWSNLPAVTFRKPFRAVPIREGRAHRARRLRRDILMRRSRWGPVQLLLAVLGLSVGALIAVAAIRWLDADAEARANAFECAAPDVLDGDTLDCGSRRVRLHGIDAPELPGHCRPGRHCTPGDPFASTESLRALIGGQTLSCQQTDVDRYGRTVARCSAGAVDLSCGQIVAGQAVRRYGWIWCGW